MTNSIEFPNSIYEFLLDNSFKDTDEVYTNGSLLIPTFRVKQAIEHYYKPCEDTVSREEALKVMCDKCPMYNCVTRCSSYRHIEKMPSVTPQPKTGHWIDDGFYAEGHSEHAYRCSECDENYIGYVGEFKYCPNCGADMRRGDSK